MRRNGLPQWLVMLMVLAVLAGLLGRTIGLVAIGLKFGIIALGVYAAILVLRALFGTSRARSVPTQPMIDHEAALVRDDEEKRALDAELSRVMQAHKTL